MEFVHLLAGQAQLRAIRQGEWWGGWGTLLILAIGLAISWATRQCLLRGQELPGGIWTTLMVGVLGAWLGSTLLGRWGWVWKGVNLIGSLIIAFALAWGSGQGLAHLWGRRRDSQ